MTIDRAGYPFIGGTAALAIAAALTVGSAGAVPLLLLAAFFLYFFRDPDRDLAAGSERSCCRRPMAVCSSPGRPIRSAAPPGEWKQISIFLSPMDVHVNRSPGLRARHESRLSQRASICRPTIAMPRPTNERSEVWVDHGGLTVVFRQIVGILARRVVCRVQPGAELKAGERFGIMKFGSRMDVFLPPSAALRVAVGDKVVGGVTVIAVLA